MAHKMEQELSHGGQYEPLPSLPELHTPDLVGGEEYEWAAIGNLDVFFSRVYRYWHEKGLVTILTSRVLNLAALGFTIVFSGFLLLWVNWPALHSSCLLAHDPHSCDILSVALYDHPFQQKPPGLVLLSCVYLLIFGLYWAWTAAHFVGEVRELLEMKHFVNNKLGISERQIQMMTWSEVAHRLALVQRTTRLCAARDLDELDIVSRIMRKENYLIAMLNSGVLALYVRGWGGLAGRRFMLTKTLEWNLYWCILDPMFDEHFHIKQEFYTSPHKLQRRLRWSAAANLAISPFLLLFLIIYFFMKNAERFYHSPGSLASRRWSSLARWRLREFNELPHYIQHRLDAAYEAACKYVAQFPSPLVNQTAKFVSFVAGSFAALLLALSLLDENLLEVPLAGRNVVWWLATTGILLTISRSVISDKPVAFDPERAMAELVVYTHYLPRHWRGRAHTAEVQQSVSSMFTFKVLLFAEELASVLLTPFILAYSLPRCADAIVEFVRTHTVRVEGVGDVCSMAVFDFDRHGNTKYGAPVHAPKRFRSKQGKMEKSFLTFTATYPTWHAPASGAALLSNLSSQVYSMGSHYHHQQQAPQQPLHGQQAAPAPGGSFHTGHSPLGKQPNTTQQQPSSSRQPAGVPVDHRLGHSFPRATAVHGVDHLQQQQQQPPSVQQQQHGAQGEGQGWSHAPGVTSPPLAASPSSPRSHLAAPAAHAGDGLSAIATLLGDPAAADLLGEPAVEWDPLLGDGLVQQQEGEQQPLLAAPPPLVPPLSSHEPGYPHAPQQQQQQASPGASHIAAGASGSGGGAVPREVRSVRFPDAAAPPQAQPPPPPAAAAAAGSHWRPNNCSSSRMGALGSQAYPAFAAGAVGDTSFQLFPSTLYPGGPSAAAGLYPGAPVAAPGAPAGVSGLLHAHPGIASRAWGAGTQSLAGSASSELLPMNETEDLHTRVATSHSLLQSFYESQDYTVQHRQQNLQHTRSALFAARASGSASGGWAGPGATTTSTTTTAAAGSILPAGRPAHVSLPVYHEHP